MWNHCACKEDLIPCPLGPHFWLLSCPARILPAPFLNSLCEEKLPIEKGSSNFAAQGASCSTLFRNALQMAILLNRFIRRDFLRAA